MNSEIWSTIERIGIALLVGILSAMIIHFVSRVAEKRLKKSEKSGERVQRLTTLVRVIDNVAYGLVILIVLLMILYELGINITPVLASAGVVGLAVSLGAQTLIKDFLAGMILLVENQYKIGDVVTLGQMTGTVERITLRATYLRDAEGKLNLVPNGDIRSVTNLTTLWAQVLITLNLEYDVDMDAAIQALEEAVRATEKDPEIAPALIETPKAIGWTGFTDWAVQAQIIAKTQPGKQWTVARVLRKNALETLKAHGIQPALPRLPMGTRPEGLR